MSRDFVILIVIRALGPNGIMGPNPWIKTGVWHMYFGMFDAAPFFPQSSFFLKLFFWHIPHGKRKYIDRLDGNKIISIANIHD